MLISNIADAHQQNPTVERMNRTIMDAVRCMLYVAKFPSAMWEYAANYAVHIRNMLVPHRSKTGITPIETLTGRKPSVKHVYIFGAHCNAMVPLNGRNKLESRSIAARLIGVTTDKLGGSPNGFLVCIRSEHYRVFKSRNIQVNEAPLLKHCVSIASDFANQVPTEMGAANGSTHEESEDEDDSYLDSDLNETASDAEAEEIRGHRRDEAEEPTGSQIVMFHHYLHRCRL